MNKIKKVTINDLDELQKISRETFKDTFGADNSEEDMENHLNTAYSTEQLTKELNNSESMFYFLMSDNVVAGYLKLNIGDAQSDDVGTDALEVERIYIRKSFKRHGFGTMLINNSEKITRELNKQSMWLGVWEHNEAAKAFYEKLGFEQIGDHIFTLGSDKQRDLILKKKLN